MYTLTIARLYITVLGTGDKQTGFYRKGINFKASIDALIILRGFSFFGELVQWAGYFVEIWELLQRPRRLSSDCQGDIGSNPILTVLKITGLKRFVPVSLKGWMKNEYYKKQAMLAPATCYHDKWLKKRIMASLHHVSRLVSPRRLIVRRGNKSTLTLYMGGDTISWGKVQ